jgi:hypothetical protein
MAPRPIASAAAIGMTTAGSVTLETTLDVLPSSARRNEPIQISKRNLRP